MKKYLVTLTVLLVAVVTLTGCGGGKTLTCSNDKGETVKATFKGDEAKTVSMKALMMEADSKEAAEEAKKTAEENFKDAKLDGVTYKASVDGTKVYVEVTFEVDKVDEETKNTFLKDVSKYSYDDLKKDAEEDGYNCK